MSNFTSDNPATSDADPQSWELPFDTIVETINDGILVCRLGGEIIYANYSMATMLGYTREQMVGKMLFDFMDEEWATRAKTNLKRRKEGVEEMFDHRWRHSGGGGVWTLVSAKPMIDDDGEQWGSLVAIQDISARKDMEEELRQARDELELRVEERTRQIVEANEMLKREVEERREAEERALEASRAKSAFLANMSHELRTPLNAVIGYTELIQEDLEFGKSDPGSLPIDSLQNDLGKVHHAAKHLLALINDILDLSKVEAGKMDLHFESFDLGELVDEVVDTIRPLIAQNDNHIICRIERPGEFVADRTKLKQVLLNLAGNATKFTEGGRIELAVEDATVGGAPGVRIDVTDSGMGIRADKIERLFDPFTQADESTTRKHGGTGLGLTICKRFCEMMGGYIQVDSTLGEGTTFSVFLPETEHGGGLSDFSTATWAPELVVEAAGDTTDGPTVLVIDDDASVHELMRRFLSPRGFRVLSAFGGQQGLQMAAEASPDAITLDVMMPGRDGWSVLSSLKADDALSAIPVVMVTMIDDKSIGYALGASDYLVKPIERERLVRVLSRFHPARGGHALVVEDEDDLREVIARQLRRADWTVRTAPNGKAALDRLDEECPDVVVLDLMMPEMDGFEVAEIMRQEPRWQDIPIVVVTAMDLDDAQQSRLLASVERILSKNVSSIEQVIAEVLAVTGTSPEEQGEDGESAGTDDRDRENEKPISTRATQSLRHHQQRMHMQQFQTDEGHEIAYRVIGSGETPLVLVHGWMVSGAVFDKLVESIDQETFRLIVPDQRGTGHSSGDVDSFEIADYVKDLRAVVDHAGVDSFGLVGHSMGGQIAQLFAAEYPVRVERLALVGSVPASGVDLPAEANELFLNSGENREAQAAILGMACLDLDDADKERLLDDAGKISSDCIRKSCVAWTGGGFADRLADIEAPTLVVASDDPFLPVEFLQAAIVDLIEGAEMTKIAGAGHYIQVERTEETAKLLQSFFGQR